MTKLGWDRTRDGWIKLRSARMIYAEHTHGSNRTAAKSETPPMAVRIDEAANLVRSVAPARVSLMALGGLAATLMLPWQSCVGWLGAGLAVEVWSWHATRAQAAANAISWRARVDFVANYAAMNAVWLLLGVLLWRTGSPEGLASAVIFFMVVAGTCALLFYTAPATFVVAGTLPAAGALIMFAVADGHGWHQVLAIGLMLCLATIFNLGRALDIPSVQEQQRWLGDSLKSYEILAENITDVITRVDQAGVCQYVSPACLATLGYRPDELVGTWLQQYFDPEGAVAITQVLARLSGDPARSEVLTTRARHRDGHWVWLQTSVKLIREHGAVTGAIGVSRDVSERMVADMALRKAYDDLGEARDAAIEANRTKTNFLANMSHELRTPLNAILGFSELLSLDAFAGRRVEYAKLIHSSGKHLLGLVSELLDLSRIEAGKTDLQFGIVRMESLIDDCLTTVGPIGRAGQIDLRRNIEPHLPDVFADRRALTQMMLNLLTNAIKFTRPGGAVEAFAKVATSGEFVFGVVDNGVGIAQDDQARMFERFGQARHDVAHVERGTGLGLPIVKGLAEAHGGRVTLESEPAAGTTVTVWLPVSCIRPRATPVAPQALFRHAG